MNLFHILFRIGTAFSTLAIGLCLVGIYDLATPEEKPRIKKPQADLINTGFETASVFGEMVDANQKNEQDVEEADEAAYYAPEGDFEIILGNSGLFENVSFYITTSEYDEKNLKVLRIVPKGAITVSNTEYPMKNILVSPLHVSFETKSVGGISFQFTGNVSVRRYKDDYGETVVTGTLAKYRDGKRIYHKIVVFEEILGC